MITGTINNIAQLAKRHRSGSVELPTVPAKPPRKASEEPTVYYSYMLGSTPIISTSKAVFVKSVHASTSPKPQAKTLPAIPPEIAERLRSEKLDI